MKKKKEIDYSKVKWAEVVNGRTSFQTTVTLPTFEKRGIEIKMDDWGDKWAIAKEEFEKLLKFAGAKLEKTEERAE